MKYFTFVLLLALSILIPSTKQDHDPLPNINYILSSIDMQIGEPFEYAFKYPPFTPFTYSQGKSIYIDSNHTFAVPDQLYCINDPSEEKTSTNEVYTSQYTLQKSLSESSSYNYNSWFAPGMYSGSQQTTYYQKVFQEQAQYMASSYLRVTNFKVSFNPSIQFNPSFQQALNNLPSAFTPDTCSQFKKFFQVYGTHFISSAIFGGSVKMTTTFDIDLIDELSIETIQTQLNQQFFLLTLSTTLTEEQEQELTQLNAVYDSTFTLIGGDPSSYNATQYQLWAKTVINNPTIVNMEIHNYTMLLDSDDTDKINALNQAIISHFYSPYKSFQIVSPAPVITYKILITACIISDIVYFPVLWSESNYYYNVKTNLWYNMQPMPQNGGYHTTACSAINDNIYCFGQNSEYDPIAYVYNTQLALWSTVPSYPNRITGGTAITIDTDIWIFGSVDDFQVTWPIWYIYVTPNPIIIFDTLKNTYREIPIPFYEYVDGGMYDCIAGYQTIRVDNNVYTFGGDYCWWVNPWFPVGADKRNVSDLVYKYDTLNNTWEQLKSMPNYLIDFSIVPGANNTLYILGGLVVNPPDAFGQGVKFTTSPNDSIYAFNYETNTWLTRSTSASHLATPGFGFVMDDLLWYISTDAMIENTVGVVSLVDSC